MKARIGAIVGALILAISFGIGSGGAAQAQLGQAQYCYGNYCLNAWNGGPEVNAYSTGVINNNFMAFANADGYETIAFTGGGTYNNQCVSDYGNNSGDARAGLDGYCQSGQIAWGANFQLQYCGNSTWAFWNVHWQGWLVAGSQDGDAFYLNVQTRHCYRILGPGTHLSDSSRTNAAPLSPYLREVRGGSPRRHRTGLWRITGLLQALGRSGMTARACFRSA